MNRPEIDLVVEEYKPPVWKVGLLALGVLTAGGLILLWSIDDPIWGNTLRLIIFAVFAGAVICGLKTMEGRYTVRLVREAGEIRFIYFKNGRRLEEESLEEDALMEVETDHLQKGLPGLYLWDEVYLAGRIRGREERMHLFHFGGRPLAFDPDTARRIRQFLLD
ncbi:MAG: hypothetical protein U5K31_14155 [Balneolaceae bacterium]|nr:hypothetical protein [Balneolaceae bacterium]